MYKHTVFLSLCVSLSLSLSLCVSLSLSLSVSLSVCLSLSLALSLSHTHTHTLNPQVANPIMANPRSAAKYTTLFPSSLNYYKSSDICHPGEGKDLYDRVSKETSGSWAGLKVAFTTYSRASIISPPPANDLTIFTIFAIFTIFTIIAIIAFLTVRRTVGLEYSRKFFFFFQCRS